MHLHQTLFNPQTPRFQKKNFFRAFFGNFLGSFLSLFSTFLSQKHIKKLLIPPFSQQSQGSVLALNLPLIGSIPWI